MSVCTEPRTTRPASRLAQAPGPPPVEELIKRMFKPPDWLWEQKPDVGWWYRPGWGDVLLGPQGLRLDEWRAAGVLTTVKSGPHRIVYSVRLEETTIFIKHFLVPNRRAVLRQWVRRGKGRNEGKRSVHLAAIGVPTITPVALGEQRKRKFLFENYLVTPAISDTIPLDEFVENRLSQWSEPLRSRIRQRLACAVAQMTARLHDAGLLHHDFHPGNILVRLQHADDLELFMIDLDAMRKCRTVTWKLARQNLALLDHYFWLRSSRTDRYRFLKTYLATRNESPPPVGQFATAIEDTTRLWAERLWRRWGRRCRSSNKYFEVFRGPRTRCVASRDLDPSQIPPLLDNPDLALAQPGARLLKNSRTTTVAETTMLVRGQPTQVIFKRFNRKKWLDPFFTLFRPPRAWRSWQAGQDLVSRGIPTPQNLAYLSRKRSFKSHPLSWFLPHETYLITVKQQGAQSLSDYVSKVLPALSLPERRARIRELTTSLAQLIRALHDRSLSHRDLKASNILIEVNSSGEIQQLSLIDLVGVALKHPLPPGRRVQNLARLCLSLSSLPGRTRTDLLRFLQLYLPWGLSPLGDWKCLWRKIDRAVHAKRARNLKRGRPLS